MGVAAAILIGLVGTLLAVFACFFRFLIERSPERSEHAECSEDRAESCAVGRTRGTKWPDPNDTFWLDSAMRQRKITYDQYAQLYDAVAQATGALKPKN